MSHASTWNVLLRGWGAEKYSNLKYVTLAHWLFWALVAWKKSKSREGFFSELSLSAIRHILQKKFSCHNFLPRSFTNQEDWLITGVETRRQHHTQKLYHELSYIPSILLRAHSPFLKNHLFSPKRPVRPSQEQWLLHGHAWLYFLLIIVSRPCASFMLKGNDPFQQPEFSISIMA